MARHVDCALILLLLSSTSTNAWVGVAAGAVVEGAATVIMAPVVLPALGFTSAAGIAAGSLAATAMSTAWSTGVGVGVVAAAQSAGAAGAVGLAGTLAGGAVGAGVGHVIASAGSEKCSDCENDSNCKLNSEVVVV